MSTFASQLLLMALLALGGIWTVRHITSAPRRDEGARYTVDDLVWRDHQLSDDETGLGERAEGGRPVSAERLREAARVLRERADSAACENGQTWRVDGMYQVTQAESTPPGASIFGCMVCEAEFPDSQHHGYAYTSEETATFIATFHPGVALAVADWLDDEAERRERIRAALARDYGSDRADDFMPTIRTQILAVADAILGGAS